MYLHTGSGDDPYGCHLSGGQRDCDRTAGLLFTLHGKINGLEGAQSSMTRQFEEMSAEKELLARKNVVLRFQRDKARRELKGNRKNFEREFERFARTLADRAEKIEQLQRDVAMTDQQNEYLMDCLKNLDTKLTRQEQRLDDYRGVVELAEQEMDQG